ncbi:NAD(P)H-binding protein [Puia dinghuensis]|uniref:NAD(P)-binding domain-containing protein n=1 Tax=Puia dinghuensis TaxID=1792502 RepID=A0A8J2UCW0_9BACT|nr:NAD(P)H-binding protein [Puia dinghuensis]GGA98382.1 hypothetical protein GCM10011511_22130 [Puia dinghuensis]
MKYVLLGSLGNITKPLATQLIKAGHNITIVSSHADRKPAIEALGATAAIGSIEDIAFLTSTFKGADAIYAMIPPKWDAKEWKQWIGGIGKKYAEAIKAAGVKKVVNLSSMGADLPDGVGPVSGLHLAEEALNALSGVDIRHLRAGFFYTNLYSNIGMIKQGGIYGNNYGADVPLTLVHPRDIAAVAAEELLSLAFQGSSVRYVASDERTSKDIAAVIGAAVGKPGLPYVEFGDEDTRKGLLGAGLSEEVVRNYTEMGVAARTGLMFADYKKHRPQLSPTKLEDFAKEFAVAFAQN